MKDKRPLLAPGSLLERQQSRKTRVLITIFGIVALHVFSISGLLLMQGCKPDAADSVAGGDTGATNSLVSISGAESGIRSTPSTRSPNGATGPSGSRVETNELYGEYVSRSRHPVTLPIDGGGTASPLRADQGAAALALSNARPAGVEVRPRMAPELTTRMTGDWAKVESGAEKPSTPSNPSVGAGSASAARTSRTPAPAEPVTGLVEHKIQPGDVLSRLASRYQTTVAALLEANPGLEPRRMRPGRTLVVPKGSALAARRSAQPGRSAAAAGRAASPDASGKVYVVKAGDNLISIANRHNVSLASLRDANNIRTHIIHPGQSLRIPVAKVAAGR